MRVYQFSAVLWLAVGGTLACAGPLAAADPPIVMPDYAVPVLTPASAPSIAAAAQDPFTRVYLLNGADPFGWSKLSGTADRLRASGYPDTRYGGWFRGRQFEREIRRSHAESPGTPVAIIGFSAGTYQAKAMAGRLTRDGIPVAMLGYIGADYLTNGGSSQPAGVGRVVNVRGDGFLLTGRNLFFNGTDLNGADNLRLPGVRHFDLPRQEETLSALIGGLDAATGRQTVTLSPAAPATTVATPSPTAAQPPVSAPMTLSPAAAASQGSVVPTVDAPAGPRAPRFTRITDRLR